MDPVGGRMSLWTPVNVTETLRWSLTSSKRAVPVIGELRHKR